MVEFALVFPLAALLLFGIVVLGITVNNQMVLNNAARISARAAAICGSTATSPVYNEPTLPNDTSCTQLTTYISGQFSQVKSGLTWTTKYYTPSGAPAAACATGYTVALQATYQQPLYLPLVGYVIGNGPNDTYTITAYGEATCEQ